jgi:hypothetical protein
MQMTIGTAIIPHSSLWLDVDENWNTNSANTGTDIPTVFPN